MAENRPIERKMTASYLY